ncbi:hypothetical protein BC829DRAFT_441113 [Chytridium lagenaria]|nr:hypothetical protein BC829DRAFT_441113 [Chytridium lagenaria]
MDPKQKYGMLTSPTPPKPIAPQKPTVKGVIPKTKPIVTAAFPRPRDVRRMVMEELGERVIVSGKSVAAVSRELLRSRSMDFEWSLDSVSEVRRRSTTTGPDECDDERMRKMFPEEIWADVWRKEGMSSLCRKRPEGISAVPSWFSFRTEDGERQNEDDDVGEYDASSDGGTDTSGDEERADAPRLRLPKQHKKSVLPEPPPLRTVEEKIVEAIWPDGFSPAIEPPSLTAPPPTHAEPFWSQKPEPRKFHALFTPYTVFNNGPIPTDHTDPPALDFESRFESGNLTTAIRVGPTRYELYLRRDSSTKGHTQWYFFRLKGMVEGCQYRFEIVNLMKPKSLYGRGLRPLVYSERVAEEKGIGWHRSGTNIDYYKTPSTTTDDHPSHTLTFTLTTPHPNDTIYLSHCYPYSYTHLQRDLYFLKLDPLRPPISVTLLSAKLELEERRGVIVTARCHPGESNASFVVKGLMWFLTGGSREAREIRRDLYRERIFPLLLSRLTPIFHFRSCQFKMQKSKEGTGRITVRKEFNVMDSFTLEASSAEIRRGDISGESETTSDDEMLRIKVVKKKMAVSQTNGSASVHGSRPASATGSRSTLIERQAVTYSKERGTEAETKGKFRAGSKKKTAICYGNITQTVKTHQMAPNMNAIMLELATPRQLAIYAMPVTHNTSFRQPAIRRRIRSRSELAKPSRLPIVETDVSVESLTESIASQKAAEVRSKTETIEDFRETFDGQRDVTKLLTSISYGHRPIIGRRSPSRHVVPVQQMEYSTDTLVHMLFSKPRKKAYEVERPVRREERRRRKPWDTQRVFELE